GLGLAPTTGDAMVESLAKSHMQNLKGHNLKNDNSVCYDNLEIYFKSPEPTRTKGQSLKSITSVTFIPLHDVVPNALNCSQYIWDRNQVNRLRTTALECHPVRADILPRKEQQDRLTQRLIWHIKAALVEIHPLFKKFTDKLGSP